MFRKTFGLAMAASTANAAATYTNISAIWELIGVSSTYFTDFEFWTYALLSLQDDTTDTSSTCYEDFHHYEELYNHVATLIADTTDYTAGLTAKGNSFSLTGNSYSIGNAAGFVMYQVSHIADVVIEFVEVYHGCRLDYYMLSVGKSLTSVPGFLNTGTNFLWRALSNDDEAIYTAISAGIADDDKAAVGAGFGEFIKIFLMADIPSTASEFNYEFVNYLSI